MVSVVHLSDCSKLEFIQPHPCFVTGMQRGCLQAETPRCGVRYFYGVPISSRPDGAARRPYQS
jgi:hypothetical protein